MTSGNLSWRPLTFSGIELARRRRGRIVGHCSNRSVKPHGLHAFAYRLECFHAKDRD